jgi:hypothetical protein
VHANDRVGVLATAAQQREEAKSNSYRSPYGFPYLGPSHVVVYDAFFS